MSLKKMTKEELELLSYTDLTEMILEENKKAMNTPTIFRTICDLLELSDSDYTNKIGDFYTSLTTDKRFLFLEDSAEWDLKDRHVVDIVVTDDDEEEDEIEIEEEDEIEPEEDSFEEDIDAVNDEDELDDGDDDLDDLVVMSEDELDEN